VAPGPVYAGPRRRAKPIGFVNVLGNWLGQVGVIPAWRGRRLGGFLVAGSLRALAAEEMWLCVNVNNPAEHLYRRMGFTSYGTRARYVRTKRPTSVQNTNLD